MHMYPEMYLWLQEQDRERAMTQRALERAARAGGEREVTNRLIADSLFISGNTAGVHVSNILGKLGVGSRTKAAAVAVRLGLDQVRAT
jgi:DNA-binding CsgD family transcriptional regulator